MGMEVGGGAQDVGCGGRGGLETHVYLWPIHVDVWQKPSLYCKVIIPQLKLKIKKIVSLSHTEVFLIVIEI